MAEYKNTIISVLRQEMQESPLPTMESQAPERRILADGYERQTAAEPMRMTKKYRQRKTRLVIRWLIIVGIITAVAVVVIQMGLIHV